MKKHWKKILLAFVSVLLIIGGYLLYIFQFKEYDVADKEVTQITKETYTLELPDGTVIELDEEGNIVESTDSDKSSSTDGTSTATSENDDKDTTTVDGSTVDTNSTSGSNSSSSNNEGTTGTSSNNDSSTSESVSGNKGSTGSTQSGSESNVTVATIKEKYSPTLSSLQEQANTRINSLVGRAMEEYQSKKANGESVNYAYFYNKYTSAAEELEGRTDTVFYQVVGIIEKELVANEFSKTHAKSLINDYEAAKEARRKALLDKAMNR